MRWWTLGFGIGEVVTFLLVFVPNLIVMTIGVIGVVGYIAGVIVSSECDA